MLQHAHPKNGASKTNGKVTAPGLAGMGAPAPPSLPQAQGQPPNMIGGPQQQLLVLERMPGGCPPGGAIPAGMAAMEHAQFPQAFQQAPQFNQMMGL